MLHDKKLPLELWGEAVLCATHILNRTLSSTNDKTPFELWNGCKPDVSYFRIFGSPAFVHLPEETRKKLDPKAVQCVLVGYCEHSKSYRLWNPAERKIIISRDVIFNEDDIFKEPLTDEEPDYRLLFPLPEKPEGEEHMEVDVMELNNPEETEPVNPANDAMEVDDHGTLEPAIQPLAEPAPAEPLNRDQPLEVAGDVEDEEEFFGWEERVPRRRSTRTPKPTEKMTQWKGLEATLQGNI